MSCFSFRVAAVSAMTIFSLSVLLSACGDSQPGDTTSSSGAGGNAPQCAVATDCKTTTSCAIPTCVAGMCSSTPKPAGMELSTQAIGDCKTKQCDGNGGAVDIVDDTDLPLDAKECTNDVCTNGVGTHVAKPFGTPCGMGGALFCDDKGGCVGCVVPSDCGADGECQHPSCTNGVCGVTNTPQGTPLASQTPGDCHVLQCDGAGAKESVVDDANLPDDGETCTDDLCNAGTPGHSPVVASTPCAEGTGSVCDDNGSCVECLSPSDCPGADDECKARACTSGSCSVIFTPNGFPIASQTPGDCKQSVCDGNGAVTSSNDDLDLPNDNDPCTANQCAGGVPQFPFEPAGTDCGPGLTCNATGQCGV